MSCRRFTDPYGRMSGVRRVGLATFSKFPSLTDDDRLLIDPLRTKGIEAVPVVWDAPSRAAEPVRMTILRSVWNYYLDVSRFLEWVEEADRRGSVWNRPPLLRWNSHKRYLLDLARHGVRTTPTELVDRQHPVSLADVRRERGWDRTVVKPAVGAAGYLNAVVGSDEPARAERHLKDVLRHSDALVQPFLKNVSALGERSLVFFDGAFSHAVEWSEPFDRTIAARAARATQPSSDALETARAAISSVDGDPMYARVDLVPGPKGEWLVSELELIEPELFLRTNPEAARRFSDAIARRWEAS